MMDTTTYTRYDSYKDVLDITICFNKSNSQQAFSTWLGVNTIHIKG